MNIIWGFFLLLGAAYWVSIAAGWLSYEPWVVTFAFVMVAIDLVMAALRSFARAD